MTSPYVATLTVAELAELLAPALAERGLLVSDESMTVAEVAALLKLSAGHVRDMARTGQLVGLKFGKEWRFAKSHVLAVLRGEHPQKESPAYALETQRGRKV